MSFGFFCAFIIAFVTMSGLKAIAKNRAGIVWFKQTDMRIRDHLPLSKAHTECEKVDHLYVFDPRHYKDTKRGNLKTNMRRLRFQVECLNDVCNSLKNAGCSITVLLGEPEVVISDYAKANKMAAGTQVYCYDDVGDEETKVLLALKKKLRTADLDTSTSFGGGTLFDLTDLPYPVEQLNGFTEFRKAVERPAVFNKMKKPLVVRSTFMPAFSAPPVATATAEASYRTLQAPISDVPDLWSVMRNWYGPVADTVGAAKESTIDARGVMDFKGGETAAWSRIDHYIANGVGKLSTYKETRNGMVGADYSSKLSPYLATGAISARSIYTEIKKFEAKSGISNDSTYWLVFELLWRDFMRFYGYKYGTKLFHLGGVQGEAGRKRYPWGNDPKLLNAWRTGNTGFPFIDANMRELAKTGFMSNRGRQIVASFLVRDMGQDWRQGAEHFETNLLDHDVTSNWGNWQYAAGVGADPREDRYFNIVKQAHSYDPDCNFIRLWCPEIAHLPEKVLLDTKLFNDQVRGQFNVPESVYPKPVCNLMFTQFKGDGSSGGRGGGGGTQTKSQKQNHGGVPGNGRTVEYDSGSKNRDRGGGGGGGGGGSGTKKNLVPISSFFDPQTTPSYGRGLTDKQLARDSIGRARQSKKRAKDDIEDEEY